MNELPGGFEFLASDGRLRGGDYQTLPVGSDFEGRLVIDFEDVENRPVDDQRQAVPVFGEFLDHRRTYNVSPLAPFKREQEQATASCAWRSRCPAETTSAPPRSR